MGASERHIGCDFLEGWVNEYETVAGYVESTTRLQQFAGSLSKKSGSRPRCNHD